MYQNKETQISRIYETKNGEVVISFRFKFGELQMEEKENLKTLWREGTPLSLAVSGYQNPDQTSL